MVKRLAVIVVAVSLVACGSGADDGLSPANAAVVQFVNAASSGSITLTLNGETVAGVGARSATTQCALIPPGSQSFKATFGSNPSTTITQNLTAGQRYTLVMWPGVGTPGSAALINMLLPESFATPESGKIGMRLINTAGSTVGPTSFDVYAQEPASALPDVPIASLSPESATGGLSGIGAFIPVPTTSTRVLWMGAGTRSGSSADLTFSFPSSPVVTITYVPQGTTSSRAFAFPQCTL